MIDLRKVGKPLQQTIEGKDHVFLDDSLPSQKKSGEKDFIGLKFTVFDNNPFLYGLENNEYIELFIGPKKLKELFESTKDSTDPFSFPIVLNFKKDGQVVKSITIENRESRKWILERISHLNINWDE